MSPDLSYRSNSDLSHRRNVRGSLKLRVFGVITAIELLFASAYVSQLVGWVMLLVACVLLGASAGSSGLSHNTAFGLRQHRQ
jgi:hypothetical protein